MNALEVSLNAVIPVFIMLAAGYISKLTGLIKEEHVVPFNKVTFNIFMAVMLYQGIVSSDIQSAFRPAMLLYCVGTVLLLWLVSVLLANRFMPEKADRSAMVQAVYRSNFGSMGAMIAASVLGENNIGATAVAIATVVPVFNVLAVITLAMYNGERVSVKGTILSVLKNPLIIGSCLGFLVLLTGLQVPKPVANALKSMAAVGSPLMLFLLGAFFRFGNLKNKLNYLIIGTVARLLLVPGVFIYLAYALGFRGAELMAIMCMLFPPVANGAYSMALQMNGNAELTGNLVVFSCALCPLTIFLWTWIYSSLGAL